ncbi:MAG: PQQ-dependent dehydrogenase, methanol/ethanol family [Candidatus Rokuibacteriota bacterium]
MRIVRDLVILGVVFAIALAPMLTDAQGRIMGYRPVTDQRLAEPEPANWLMTRGNYEGWSYSPLDQINVHNVKKLAPAWALSTGVDSGHQAPLLVNNGIMFVATPYNQVIAVEAKSGKLLWRYKREMPEGHSVLHNTSRGVALHGDKVYLPTHDSFLVALDATTGKVVWEQKVEDWKTGYYMTLAPLVAKGKVMVGVSGGEFGVRGFVQAFDAQSGQPAWKTYMIPGPGEPGHETWTGDTWMKGGGSVWMTGTYDRALNVTYWGTGNASPWFGDQRPGDNLYTSSSVALDADTGKIRGHFQYHWNDSWDWDEPDAPMVIDYTKDGRTVKGLVHAARNGYLYWLERSSDKISFVSATPYVKQNVFKSIDAKTGRPEYYPDRVPRTGKRADFCPSLWGGKDWPFAAYNPKSGMLFIPANDNHCGYMEGKIQPYVAGKWWTGVDIPDIGFAVDKSGRHFGEVQAWDINGNKRVWSHLFTDSMNWGPVLTTAGGLVFGGGTNDRYFRAFDASTGEVLWQFRTNSGVTAPPVSFAIDGVQYIGVASGWGVDPAFQQGLLADLLGWQKDVPQGGVIWVFAVGQ